MNTAWFRFYEELNDFLPSVRRKQSFSCNFSGNPSVKYIIESLGIPHVEVDLILVNSNSVDFSYKVKDGDHVSVYPVFESLDITKVTHLRAKPLRHVKFVSDVHLGKLARYLRLCGFDTLYDSTYSDDEIIRISVTERRIILTRDKDLLKNKLVLRGYWIRSPKPEKQLEEVFTRFDLRDSARPFSRCMQCNSLLTYIEKEKISDRLMPNTREFYTEFWKCPGCDRIYWEGSHFTIMKKQLDKLLKH
jgi:hypothetical protein